MLVNNSDQNRENCFSCVKHATVIAKICYLLIKHILSICSWARYAGDSNIFTLHLNTINSVHFIPHIQPLLVLNMRIRFLKNLP